MKPLLTLIICIAVISCNQQADKITQTAPVNVDLLNAAFLQGWNNKDSVAIMKTIADNAVVMNDSLIHTGTDAIAKNWISGGMHVISNVKTISSIKDGNANIAYDGGTYTLDLIPPGGRVLKEKGNYTLVWAKQQDNNWKLTLIHIEDVTRLPDIK